MPPRRGRRTAPLVTPDAAIAEAESGELRPIYLVLGEEQHLQGRVVSALRAATGGAANAAEDVLTAGEASVDAVLAAARTRAMFAPRRTVLVRAVERWEAKDDKAKSAKKSALDRLAEYAADPVPSTTLILVATKINKRRKLVTAATKQGWLVSCEAPSRRELPAWIARTVAERGCTIHPGTADLVAELAGPELSSVADTVERLCLFVGDGGEIGEDAVAECVVRVRPTTVWELVDAVAERDAGKALAALQRVYDPHDRGLRLVGVLAWSARQLIQFEAATREGASPRDAAARAGVPPFKARDLAGRVKRIPRRDLEKWLETLAAVDRALKGGSKRAPRAVLETAIVQMCTGRRGLDPTAP